VAAGTPTCLVLTCLLLSMPQSAYSFGQLLDCLLVVSAPSNFCNSSFVFLHPSEGRGICCCCASLPDANRLKWPQRSGSCTARSTCKIGRYQRTDFVQCRGFAAHWSLFADDVEAATLILTLIPTPTVTPTPIMTLTLPPALNYPNSLNPHPDRQSLRPSAGAAGARDAGVVGGGILRW